MIKDKLAVVLRYQDDVNVPIDFIQGIDSSGHEVLAEVFVIGSDALVESIEVGTTLAGNKGEKVSVPCNFSNLDSADNYVIKFRTAESGVLGKAALAVFGPDGFTIGDDIETNTYPVALFTTEDRARLNSIIDDWIPIAISDVSTDLATQNPASDKVTSIETPDETWYLHDLFFTTDDSNAPTGASTTLQARLNGSSIFSTQPTIDAGEWDSRDAATPYVLTSNPDPLEIPAKSRLDFYLTSIGSSNAGNNCIVWVLLKKTN